MKPGRELDALVAEKVMGSSKQAVDLFIKIPTSACYIPPYSTDIAAAWEVFEYLRKKEPYASISPHPPYPGSLKPMMWEVWDSFDPEIGECLGEAETAPHAICLAALKAYNAF